MRVGVLRAATRPVDRPLVDVSEIGADAKGECQPASVWIKASRLHPLIPHETERWKSYYRQRTAVERELGRLKTGWGLTPLRIRRLLRVALHVDLTILSQLADALARTA